MMYIMESKSDFQNSVKTIWKEIKELHLGIAQKDNNHFFDSLNNYFGNISLNPFESGSELNGWVVPRHWSIKRATITDSVNTELTLDKIFGVPSHSPSQEFVISDLDDPRIFLSQASSSATPWHVGTMYRPWEQGVSGFCISKNQLESLKFPLRVYLETQSEESKMLVGEFQAGNLESESTIFFNAHTCHPGQFQDAFVGVITFCHLLSILKSKETKLRYNYLGVFGPEHIGTVYYLNNLDRRGFDFSSNSHLAIYCEMTALSNPISLQESLLGNSILDRLIKSLVIENNEFRTGPFRSIVGNDETVWESVGIEVPCISISRVKSRKYFPGYHTNEDDILSADLDASQEVMELILRAVEILEKDYIPVFNKRGLVCFSNPRYNLYTPWPDPTTERFYGSKSESIFAILQDVLPRFLTGKFSCLEIALALGLSFEALDEYLSKWHEKAVIEQLPVQNLNFYRKQNLEDLSILSNIVQRTDADLEAGKTFPVRRPID